jgi:ADP-ribose pyrophosphatase YjhB (NUDIX family)
MPDVPRRAIYEHCPRCGKRAMTAKHAALACSDCKLELFVNPSPAVGAIVLDAEGRVLLIRRAHEPGQGLLAMPGGFVDEGEIAESAVRREIREEVGLELGEVSYLVSAVNHYSHGGVVYTTLDLFFVARVATFETAQPLDGVAEIVLPRIAEVDEQELAFDSMKVAWREFLRRI